jgi:prevent-host-death family protein
VTEIIKQSELRNNNADVMRRVAAGESFTVTVNGVPVADVVPHQRTRKPVAIPAEELDRLMAELPPIDVEAWYEDRAALDDEVRDPYAEKRTP